ncbi:MAG TPA: hypothetical protein VFB96_10015 [Pirellulaceae bacterium]|nr:hypothetical protein [Pirellulaceae bacterium]
MWKLARSILGVVVGMLLAMALITGIDALNHTLYPPPAAVIEAGTNMQAAASAIKEWLPHAPLGALVLIPTAWIVATFAGTLAAALIAGRAPLIHALLAGLLPLAGTVMVLRMIPHPIWLAVAGLAGVPLASLAAGMLVQKAWSTGPKPYDMREKNMAC